MKTDITGLLAAAHDGDRASEQRVLELVYAELHRLAASYMRRERRDHTLQTSALVNEAYLKLLGSHATPWESRAHFYIAAARVMRNILIDHARRKSAAKRDGVLHRVELNDALAIAEDDARSMLDLDAAIERLGSMDARQKQIVELRFFAGLTVEETAATLAISEKTVKRDWASARAWLEGELRGNA